ncbi:hypothetical protein [Burkholderia sp. RS02]|uniref:hypothetical protein n=1 Tax=unclassified Burkholderia TaxID=2613784 RepID=UPI003218BB52
MTDDEFVRDMQINIVQLANALADQTDTPREAIAQFFRSVAEAHSATDNHKVVAQVLKQAAEEIDPKSDSIEDGLVA